MTTPTTVAVPVTSAWSSKINWTQIVSVAAMLGTVVSGGALSIPADQQAAIVTAIGVLSGVTTFIFRTYFTSTVLPPSAAGLPTVVVAPSTASKLKP